MLCLSFLSTYYIDEVDKNALCTKGDKMYSKLKYLLHILIIILLTACSTTITQRITTEPAGASVYISIDDDFQYAGTSPLQEKRTAVAPFWPAATYKTTHPGYKPALKLVEKSGVNEDRYLHIKLTPINENIENEREDKIVDNFLRGETFPDKPLFKAKVLVNNDKLVDGKFFPVIRFGDIVEVLRTENIFWVIRTKDHLVYCESPKNLKAIEDKADLSKDSVNGSVPAYEILQEKKYAFVKDNVFLTAPVYKAPQGDILFRMPKYHPMHLLKKHNTLEYYLIETYLKDDRFEGWIDLKYIHKDIDAKAKYEALLSKRDKEKNIENNNEFKNDYAFFVPNYGGWMSLSETPTGSTIFKIPSYDPMHIITHPIHIITTRKVDTHNYCYVETYLDDQLATGWTAKKYLNITPLAMEKYKKYFKGKPARNLQDEIDRILAVVKPIPSSNYKENLKYYNQLVHLDSDNETFKSKAIHYESKIKQKKAIIAKKKREEAKKKHEEAQKMKIESEKKALDKRKVMVEEGYSLEITSWRWFDRHGYAIAEGQVRNITDRQLENVEAVVSWYNKDGDFTTSNSSLIEYRVLMPNQLSPFKVMKSYNPLMNNATLEFKFLFGGKIESYKNFERH